MALLRLTHSRPEVPPEASVRETVRIMAEAQISAIAVREGTVLLGIFTERDLARRIVAKGRDPDLTPISQVMSTDLVTVTDATPVATAAATMRTRGVRHLVVIDAHGSYLGIVAQRHVLYELMSDLAGKVADLTGYFMTDGPGG